jgi:hypothetical protein
MKPKVYFETTVISYLTARKSSVPILAGRQQVMLEWWENRRGFFDLSVSEIVVQEAEDGDSDAVRRRLEVLEGLPLLVVTAEAAQLADALVREGVIPKESVEDSLHIAVAAVNGMDYLLTWNCRHIANAALRARIEYVVESRGYLCPIICTPEELMED